MTVKSNDLAIGWKVASPAFNIASVRYRAMLPLLALEDRGYKCQIFSKSSFVNVDGLEALVIVKSFSADDFLLVQQASLKGVPVILDLCDNIFVNNYGVLPAKPRTSPANIFVEIARFARVVVVSTEPLADIVRQHLGEEVLIRVIPDGIETKSLLKRIRTRLESVSVKEKTSLLEAVRRLESFLMARAYLFRWSTMVSFSRRATKRIEKELHWKPWAKMAYRGFDGARTYLRTRRQNKAALRTPSTVLDRREQKRILWFGNHGAPHAKFGMLDLLHIREPLEKIATEFKVELTVVSNNVENYNKHIRPFAIPSRYIEWSADTIDRYLEDSDVVVIPNSLDAFSVCKSCNRTVLALLHGTPVVATATAAVEALRGCVILDDFEKGLSDYLGNPELARRHVRQAQTLVEQLYGQEAISNAWADILDTASGRSLSPQLSSSPELIVALHLPQDTDLALPILAAASERGFHVAIWSSISAIKKWPLLFDEIRQSGFAYRILPDQLVKLGASVFPASVCAILSMSESNLAPHRFTYQLSKLATKAGLYTATVQHGFENIGLTYSDDVHNIEDIKFASRRIYTWGHLETYHPKLSTKARMKCFPVGCPKPEVVPTAEVMASVSCDKHIIGIFENLHWHRYSEEYRTFFVDSVWRVAKAFPNVVFLIKPHNAGMWLTKCYQQQRPEADNLVTIDPLDPAWGTVTAPQMLGRLTATITTPSTVAVDVARRGLPVAVVAHELTLPNYEPLPLIRHFNDWRAFIMHALDTNTRTDLEFSNRAFVERVILPGDAAQRIVHDLISQTRSSE